MRRLGVMTHHSSEEVRVRALESLQALTPGAFETTALKYFIPLFFLFGVGLFGCILLALETGRRFGVRLGMRRTKGASEGVGAVDGAVFGLMGLLIGFTFSSAASRFDARRASVVQEANTIGTAYLRMKLLPIQYQPEMQDRFRRYIEARIAAYKKLPDLAAARAELQKVAILQGQIWTDAIAGCMETRDPAVKSLVLGSLNEMFDMAQTRTEQSRIHPPMVIPVMLLLVVLVCSMLAGNLMAGNEVRNWIHILLFSLSLSVAVLVILDLEYPRIGSIRLDDWDRVLLDLRASMN